MRQQKIRRQINKPVLDMLGLLYDQLLGMCRERTPRGYGCYSVEDIVGETIVFVSQDSEAIGLDRKQLVNWFMYRFDMIRFQISKDLQQLKEKQYADNIQAEEDD